MTGVRPHDADDNLFTLGGFTCRLAHPQAVTCPPVVLLHGTNGNENALLDFGGAVAPNHALFALRGPTPWNDGYTFILRKDDGSLDLEDLARQVPKFEDFLQAFIREYDVAPILIGYSIGAILSTALIGRDPSLVAGVVLLRPMPPQPDFQPAALNGTPVLMIGGRHDERRLPQDFPDLQRQLIGAGADVTAHMLDAGHGLERSGLDIRLTRDWITGFETVRGART